MKTVRDLLQARTREVITINSSQTVYEALVLLAENNIGALPVVEEKQLVGILSERDYARKVILKGASSLDTPVKKIMTERLISVTPEQRLNECLEIISERHIRHLPVVDQGNLIGILSIGDLVKVALEEKDKLIESLQTA